MRFKARKCRTLEDVQAWVSEERAIIKDKHRPARTSTDIAHSPSVNVVESPCQSLSSACLAANGALSLLNLACFLLDRQLAAQAEGFEKKKAGLPNVFIGDGSRHGGNDNRFIPWRTNDGKGCQCFLLG